MKATTNRKIFWVKIDSKMANLRYVRRGMVISFLLLLTGSFNGSD